MLLSLQNERTKLVRHSGDGADLSAFLSCELNMPKKRTSNASSLVRSEVDRQALLEEIYVEESRELKCRLCECEIEICDLVDKLICSEETISSLKSSKVNMETESTNLALENNKLHRDLKIALEKLNTFSPRNVEKRIKRTLNLCIEELNNKLDEAMMLKQRLRK